MLVAEEHSNAEMVAQHVAVKTLTTLQRLGRGKNSWKNGHEMIING